MLLNSSAIPDNYKDTKNNKITNPFGGELQVTAATGNNPGYGYQLTLTGLPTSPCISLGTLNLGTSTAGYAISANGNPGFPANGDKGPISPANAATQCKGNSIFPTLQLGDFTVKFNNKLNENQTITRENSMEKNTRKN